MRKLFIILVGLLAVVTFIRAFDHHGGLNTEFSGAGTFEAASENQNSGFPEEQPSGD